MKEVIKINIYLLDYENNIMSMWLNNMSLNKGDEVVLFYSQNKSKIDIDILDGLISTDVKLTLERVESLSKNAMDFCLIAYLGLRLGDIDATDESNYYIVSNDRDYEVPIEFLKNRGYRVEQINIQTVNEELDEKEKLRICRNRAQNITAEDIKELLDEAGLNRLKGGNTLRSIRRFLKNSKDLESYKRELDSSMDRRIKHYYKKERPDYNIFIENLNKKLLND